MGGMSTLHLRTSVAIIGGGPAGLMLAIELGCRGVACVVLEEDADAPLPPKANATSARTMEHYRRRGFADAVRAVGLTEDHPQADEVPDPHALPLRTLRDCGAGGGGVCRDQEGRGQVGARL